MNETHKTKLKILALCLILLLVGGFVGYTIANPSNTAYLEGGIYPGAPSYTIWKEGSTYYAKSAYGSIDYSGANAITVVQTVENAVDDSGGIIYIKGFQLPSGVVLSSNVMVIEEYQGVITYYNEFRNQGVLEPYFTDNGYFQTNIAQPRAYYYEGTYNRTYIAYQGYPDMDPYVTYYDHDWQTWATPVKIGDQILTNDNHGTPVLIVDDSGYIHVAYGSHSLVPGYFTYRKSTNSEDISAWTSMSNLATNPTYPNWVKVNSGNLYLIHRTYESAIWSKIKFIMSSDGGSSWGAATTMIDFGSGYSINPEGVEFDSTNNRIHLAWEYRDESGDSSLNNAYHAYYDVSTAKMYSADGTDLGGEVSKAEADANCLVYSGYVYNPRVRVSPNGTIAMTIPTTVYGLGWENPYTTYFKRWTGSAWTSATLIIAANKTYGYPNFRWVNNTALEAFIPTYIGYNSSYNNQWGGYMTRWLSTDRGATWDFNQWIFDDKITQHAEHVVNAHSSNELTWIVGATYHYLWGVEEYDFKIPLYAWGENGFVYRRYYNG